MSGNRATAVGVLFALVIAAPRPSQAEYEFRRVADSSTQMPGSDERFQSFSQGAIAAGGSIFFTGHSCDIAPTLRLPCSVTGLYEGGPSGIEKIFDNSDSAPGTGTTFTGFGNPQWAAGSLGFGAGLRAGGRGIFLRAGSQTELLATASDVFNPLPTADFNRLTDFEVTERYVAVVATPAPPLLTTRNLYIIHPTHIELSFEGSSGPGFEPSEVHVVDDHAFLAGTLETDVHIHDLQTNTTVGVLRGGDPLPNGEEVFHEFLLPTGDSDGIFFLAWISDGFPISGNPPKGVFELREGEIRTLRRSDQPDPDGGEFGHFNHLLAASGRWILATGDPDTPGVVYRGFRQELIRVIGVGDILNDRPIEGLVPLDFDGRQLLLRIRFGPEDEALYLAIEKEVMDVPALGTGGMLLFSGLLGIAALAKLAFLFHRGTA